MLPNLLFPEIKETIKDIKNKYPKRPEWQIVTRMAPSPTWFVHIWNVYSAMLDDIFAHKDKWVAFLRIEDTDQKREVEWARFKINEIFKTFWLVFDEGPIWPDNTDIWDYWPYTQSKREYL